MKHIYNLLLLTAFLLAVLNGKADQLTITFTNPVPAAPVNCGDTWSEQGVEMEVITPFGNCNFDYGNGNLNLHSILQVDLFDLGIVNTVTISFFVGCCINFEFLSGTTSIHQESKCYDFNSFNLYEFINDDYDSIEYLEINPNECPGTILFDITIDYTPICESEPISNVRNGDVYLNDACYGVVMTSPSGNCFRAKVADNGMLFTEPVECP